jgi:hypothetical protein
MQPIEIPGLSQCERAFVLEGGCLAVVSITRVETPDARHVAMRVAARQVDESGATVAIGGVPVVAPTSVTTILTDAIASGTTTIQSEMARATTEAVDKLVRHRAAMLAWAVIPSAPPTP